jgi:hypothetical protein
MGRGGKKGNKRALFFFETTKGGVATVISQNTEGTVTTALEHGLEGRITETSQRIWMESNCHPQSTER